jgi:tetratricopeptide (TPR) repeat protein
MRLLSTFTRANGIDLAVAKVAGRLIGLSPQEVSEGVERAQHRRAWISAAAGAAAAVLATAGGIVSWQSQRQARAWEEVASLVERYERAAPTQATDPGAKESLVRAFTVMAEGAKRDPRYFEALELLNAGRLAESERLLNVVAEERAKRSPREGAAAYRALASVAAIAEPGWAREYYAEATRLDPRNIEGLFRNGWLLQVAGQLDAAEASYRRVIASVLASNDEWVLWSHLGIGDIDRERGRLEDALASYQTAGAIAESLAGTDPGNARWQYDNSIAHQHIADLLFAFGDRALALRYYRAQETILSRLDKAGGVDREHGPAVTNSVGDVPMPRDHAATMLATLRGSLAHMERLAKTDIGDAGWQRDLAVAYGRVGSLLMWQDNLPEALAYFTASLSILDRLARLDPGNVGWQRDLAAAYARIGDVGAEQDDLASALASYQAGIAISARLVGGDPGNLRWQRELARTHRKTGDVLARQDNLPDALKFYQTSLAMAEPLAASELADAAWWREISVTHNKMGDVLVRRDRLPEARKSYSEGLAIAKRLLEADPENQDRLADLAQMYETVGQVLKAEGDLAEAVKSYKASLAMTERLIIADPGGTDRQHDVAVTYRAVGDMLKALGDLPEALKSYRASLAIAQRMRANGLDNSGGQRELAATSFEIGDVLRLQGKLPDALKSYQSSLAS